MTMNNNNRGMATCGPSRGLVAVTLSALAMITVLFFLPFITGAVIFMKPPVATGAAFSPSDISGLQLWLKASALSLSDGDPVSTWTDSSGNGRHATQSGSERPTFKTAILNGKPVIRFNGTDEFMVTAANSYAVQCMFVIFKRTGLNTSSGGTGDYCAVISSRTSNANKVGNSDAAFSWDFVATSEAPSNNKVSGQATPDYVSVDSTVGSNTDFSSYLTGLTAALNSWHVGYFTLASATAGGNKEFAIGADSFTALGRLLEADIAEIIIYSTAPSPTERGNLHTYATTEYGL